MARQNKNLSWIHKVLLYMEEDYRPSSNCVIVFGIAANTISNMPVWFIPTTANRQFRQFWRSQGHTTNA